MLPRLCVHFRLGLSDYEKVWKYQKALVEEICLHRSLDQNESHGRSCDFLITCTHSDTYTLGRGGLVENISSSCLSYGRVVRVERGGDVTWHGPGQMVAYPIIDLTKHKKDLHWYVRSLEESVISALEEVEIKGHRSDLNSGTLIDGISLSGSAQSDVITLGVWVNNDKISAVGIAASRWVTMHGISVNVNCDMTMFKSIIPCGINDSRAGVTSVATLKTNPIKVEDMERLWLNSLAKQFNFQLVTPKSYFASRDLKGLDVGDSDDHVVILDNVLSLFPKIKSENLIDVPLESK